MSMDNWNGAVITCNTRKSVYTFMVLSLQETYEVKRHEFLGELQRKEEEMRQMFVQRVKEKEALLKEAEREVSRSLLNLVVVGA